MDFSKLLGEVGASFRGRELLRLRFLLIFSFSQILVHLRLRYGVGVGENLVQSFELEVIFSLFPVVLDGFNQVVILVVGRARLGTCLNVELALTQRLLCSCNEAEVGLCVESAVEGETSR